jgi:hypothetical protein
MSEPEAVDAPDCPVKLIAAILWRERDVLDAALLALEAVHGPIDHVSRDLPFTATSYYEREMGSSLVRRLISFERVIGAAAITDVRLGTGEIEARSSRDGRRRVNIDPGYLDLSKVVLASTKHLGHKIYLGRGVSADLVCRYERGRFRTFDWTFPDFASGAWEADLLAIRAIHLRAWRDALGESGST